MSRKFTTASTIDHLNYHLIKSNFFVSLDFHEGIPVIEVYNYNGGLQSSDDLLDRFYPSVIPDVDSIEEDDEDILHRNALVVFLNNLILEKYG